MTPNTPARLRFGTSSWSEKSWVGPFYPKGMEPGEYLRHYATQFDTVEADNTYYRIPAREMVRGWWYKTPEDFVLSAKFPRSIVHAGEGEKPNAAEVLTGDVARAQTDAFLSVMELLGSRCGPLVLQFPYFNRTAFASLREFLDRLEPFLEKLPTNFRYGVEIRNKAWLVPELTDVLRRHNVALVLVDIAYMPHPADVATELDVVTTDFAYCRLIGDRKVVDALTKKFDRVVLDQGARLDRWAAYLSMLQTRVREIYTYANNHYAGYAPETIRDLAGRIHHR